MIVKDNKIIYQAGKDGEDVSAISGITRTGRKPGGYNHYTLTYKGKPAEEISVPLDRNGVYLGDARVGFGFEDMAAHIKETHDTIRGYSVAGTFIISGAVIVLLMWLVVLPVKRLSAAAEAISRGEVDFALSERRSQDEIGRLNNSFAEMQRYIREIADNAEKVSEGKTALFLEMKTQKDMLGAAFIRIISYIREMVEITEEIAQGDLTREHNPRSRDDIMGNAFKKMTGNLRELISKIIEQAESVTGSAEELSQIAEQSRSAVTQVAETISHITQAISQTAENAMNASVASAEANVSSKNGRETMSALTEKMQSLQESIMLSTKKMNALSGHSKEISDILT